MGSNDEALVVMSDCFARSEVSLQPLPVEAEVGTDAWVVRDAKIVIEKKSVDGFHEFERKEIRCLIRESSTDVSEYIEHYLFDKLEQLRKEKGSKEYSEKMFVEVLGKDLEEFFSELEKIGKKCGIR